MTMTSELQYPGALFAKRFSSHEPPGHEYSLLFAHKTFSYPEYDVLLKRFTHFQWKPGGDNSYQAVFAWTKVQNSAFCVRYIDDGNDDKGRPHCARIEFLLIPLTDAQKIISAFANETISSFEANKDTGIWQFTIGQNNKQEDQIFPVDNSIRYYGKTNNCLLLPEDGNSKPPQRDQIYTKQEKRKKKGFWKIFFCLFLLMTVCTLGYVCYSLTQEKKALSNQIILLTDTRDNLEKEVASTKIMITKKEKLIKELKNDKSVLETENVDLKKLLQEKDPDLEQMRKERDEYKSIIRKMVKVGSDALSDEKTF